jgi:16S rRNA (uracil1498-N3)-methyltransferase
VNIILFSPAEVELPLPRSDSRARHILTVLRRQPGEKFDAGVINGPRGKGSVVAIEPDHLRLAFTWAEPPPPPSPLVLIVGLPRPQTARDILRDATALGVAAMHFVRTARGEASYGNSSLWQTREWEACLMTGAAQAFCTRLPEVTHGRAFAEVITGLPAGQARLALDNYEASIGLAGVDVPASTPVVLALGAERGWADGERELLRRRGFTLAHLGQRVLRIETAGIAAITLIKAKCGWL